jgi:hypothetical protein
MDKEALAQEHASKVGVWTAAEDVGAASASRSCRWPAHAHDSSASFSSPVAEWGA